MYEGQQFHLELIHFVFETGLLNFLNLDQRCHQFFHYIDLIFLKYFVRIQLLDRVDPILKVFILIT